MATEPRALILASTSPYRRELLHRLRLPFTTVSPGVDETALPGEAPAALAQRLALAKAQAVAARCPQATVIGSDQVAGLTASGRGNAGRDGAELRTDAGADSHARGRCELDADADAGGVMLGKPGCHAAAARQLRLLSGRNATFHTAVAVVAPGRPQGDVVLVPVHVRFRELTDGEIDRYLLADRPYDCAGSAKVEALGIALLERVTADDPTALIGLPLIATCRLLRAVGIDPLAAGSLA